MQHVLRIGSSVDHQPISIDRSLHAIETLRQAEE
ncbi:unnamed protein product [Victoria cruziana]